MGVMDTAMEAMVMDMAMDITATMARGRPRLLPLLSLDTATMVMDMVMDTAMEAMVMDTAMDITATTARDLLMLSPAMDTMVIMDMVVMDIMAMVTDMAMATTDKFLLLFSA